MADETNDLNPIVRIAVTCDRLLLEKDDTISLIRVVDQFVLTAEFSQVDEPPPEQMPSTSFDITAVLSTVAGEARGQRVFGIGVVKPGQPPPRGAGEGPSLQVQYDAEMASRNWVVQLKLTVREPGVYWIEWTCNGQIFTRSPVQIRYERQLKTEESVH